MTAAQSLYSPFKISLKVFPLPLIGRQIDRVDLAAEQVVVTHLGEGTNCFRQPDARRSAYQATAQGISVAVISFGFIQSLSTAI